MDDVKALLSGITEKKRVYLTRRGNISIKEALSHAKSRGLCKVLLQDMGGWITYRQFGLKLKLKVECIKTDYGIPSGHFEDSILLVNSMPAYAYLIDESKISTKNCLVINDVTGSIGRPVSRWGDIIIGSFGKDKPVNLGTGGFIAADFDMGITEWELSQPELKCLAEKLKSLDTRIKQLSSITASVKRDLAGYNIVHPELEGINVIVKTGSEREKKGVTDYCKEKGLEFTECPRYIRISEPGISIEVKRIN